MRSPAHVACGFAQWSSGKDSRVDFQKAFDSINHKGLWEALSAQGVPQTYIHFLQKLYHNQSGVVQTDCLSKPFVIGRGTRQGDPISPILFNSALEALMRKLCEKWRSKGKLGVSIRNRRLTNLRFADDLLLFAPSLRGAKQMLSDLVSEAAQLGLKVHETKTTFIWNGHGRPSECANICIQGNSFEVLGSRDSTMYLGWLLCFEQTHDREIQHRITKAWTKFAVYLRELTDCFYDLEKRIKLFQRQYSPHCYMDVLAGR